MFVLSFADNGKGATLGAAFGADKTISLDPMAAAIFIVRPHSTAKVSLKKQSTAWPFRRYDRRNIHYLLFTYANENVTAIRDIFCNFANSNGPKQI